MPLYRSAAQNFRFPYSIPELAPFAANETVSSTALFAPNSFRKNELISRAKGWVGGAQRKVETWSAPAGVLLKVEDGSDFYISSDGQTIRRSEGKLDLQKLDREILVGPVLVLALALRGVWSLHASAAMYKENIVVFLGESGQGKSTLAAYLSQNKDWRLVTDDILPTEIDASGVYVLPHFPQLKLPMDAQPCIGLPERLPLKTICVLAPAAPDVAPELQALTTAQGVQTLLSHIAGTRLFSAELLAKHLEFSAQVGKQIPAYRLVYPHRRDTLPLVKEFLEKICR